MKGCGEGVSGGIWGGCELRGYGEGVSESSGG